GVARAGGQAGDGVGEVAVAVVLVDRLGRGIGQAGGGDRVRGGRGRAAGEVLIGRERRGRRTASGDIHAARTGTGTHGPGEGGGAGRPGGVLGRHRDAAAARCRRSARNQAGGA